MDLDLAQIRKLACLFVGYLSGNSILICLGYWMESHLNLHKSL